MPSNLKFLVASRAAASAAGLPPTVPSTTAAVPNSTLSLVLMARIVASNRVTDLQFPGDAPPLGSRRSAWLISLTASAQLPWGSSCSSAGSSAATGCAALGTACAGAAVVEGAGDGSSAPPQPLSANAIPTTSHVFRACTWGADANRRRADALVARGRAQRHADALRHEARERGHDHRVELLPGAPVDLVERILRRHRRTVGAVRRHRVEGVADRHDAGAERYLLTHQAVRIAAPVIALVTRADQPRHALERRCRAQDAVADDGVLAHEAPLGVVERARLVENRVGHGDLADVVQLRRAHHLVELLAAESEVGGNGARQVGDVVDVLAQLRLALLERLEQRARRLAADREAPPPRLLRVEPLVGQLEHGRGGGRVAGDHHEAARARHLEAIGGV